MAKIAGSCNGNCIKCDHLVPIIKGNFDDMAVTQEWCNLLNTYVDVIDESEALEVS